MSTVSQVLNNGQQAITNYDLSKIFIGGNRYDKANYTNSGYDPVTLSAGTLMGRVSANQKIVPHVSTASDGSQYPVGILASEVTVDDGDTVELYFCTAGDVAEGKVILGGSDTLDTVISGRSIRDRIAADTVGIKLVAGTEMTAIDNQ